MSWSASYAFPHELMREATERDLAAPSRRRLHRRAADAIRDGTGHRAAPPWSPGTCGPSGPLADPAETAEWSLRAAREARALEAWDEAIEHAEQAVAVLAGLPDRAAYAAAAEETARLRVRSTRDYPRAVALLEAGARRARRRARRREGRPGCTAAWASRSACTTAPSTSRARSSTSTRPSGCRPTESYQVHTGRTQAAMFGVRTALLDSSQRRRPARSASGTGGATWSSPQAGPRGGRCSTAGSWPSPPRWPRRPGRAAHDLASPYLVWSAAQAPAVRSTIYLLDAHTARSWCRRALGMPRFAALGHSHDTVVDQLGARAAR